MVDIEEYLFRVKKVRYGFKDIEKSADEILAVSTVAEAYNISIMLYKSDEYQVRSLATFILGRIASKRKQAFNTLKNKVSKDEDWRVQEILAKSFDRYCADVTYEKSLPVIKEWLNDSDENIRRAVTEGLRIWTGRPYFKENPEVAIALLSKLRCDESLYVRKSVGNALKDISKKHSELVEQEFSSWKLENKKIAQVYNLATKFIGKR